MPVPFLVHNGWLYSWIESKKEWVSMRELKPGEMDACKARAIPPEQATLYGVFSERGTAEIPEVPALTDDEAKDLDALLYSAFEAQLRLCEDRAIALYNDKTHSPEEATAILNREFGRKLVAAMLKNGIGNNPRPPVAKPKPEGARLQDLSKKDLHDLVDEVYRGVRHLAAVLGDVHARHCIVHTSRAALEYQGQRAYAILETLADALCGMDARDEDEDGWFDPILNRAREVFGGVPDPDAPVPFAIVKPSAA